MTVQSSPTNFADRHIGARRQADIDTMLKAVGYDSVDGLVDVAVPDSIRQAKPLALKAALSEVEVLAELRRLAGKNKTAVQMIGQGYYDTITPAVIRRNVLEAPAWYTAYTPYQPEISQGTLQAMYEFQSLIAELTAMDVANASLYDGATAVAEAAMMAAKTETRASDCASHTLRAARGLVSAGVRDAGVGWVMVPPGGVGRRSPKKATHPRPPPFCRKPTSVPQYPWSDPYKATVLRFSVSSALDPFANQSTVSECSTPSSKR
ncbi:MAG: hypothetical protein NVS2B15_22990 [Pseudarthrobacter sp.]